MNNKVIKENSPIVGDKATELIQFVNRELSDGNLIILLGGICSGKSWLVNQVFKQEAVIDKSIHALRGDYDRVHLGALEKWAARTKESIAIDEAQLYVRQELLDISEISVSCGKGLAIATQQLRVIPEPVIEKFIRKEKRVVIFRLEYWNPGTLFPDWRYEIKSRYARGKENVIC